MQITRLADGRFYGTYRNWYISSGEPDDAGRPPLKVVRYVHDCQDGSDDRHGWADTIEEAVAIIDAMPNFGDREGDDD